VENEFEPCAWGTNLIARGTKPKARGCRVSSVAHTHVANSGVRWGIINMLRPRSVRVAGNWHPGGISAELTLITALSLADGHLFCDRCKSKHRAHALMQTKAPWRERVGCQRAREIPSGVDFMREVCTNLN
jgi:hypothetical protein